MSNKVLLKKSSVAAKVPLTTDLDYGELALNYADGKLYFKNASNVIKSFTIDDSVVTLTGTQTLTNKTLTSPTINGGALSGTFSGAATLSGAITLSNTTASTSATTGALTIGGGLGVAGTIYANQIRLLSNGAGTNVAIGDDAWLGDINASNTVGVRGQQDPTKGYIVFGDANSTNYIGRDGANPLTVTGQFKIDNGTVTGSSAIGLQMSGYANKGGTGYHDFLSVTSTYGSVTNPNKFFRLNSTGGLEIINSAYTATILSLSDAGVLMAPQISAGGSTGTSGQVLQSTGTGLQWASVGGTGTVTSITAGTGLTGGTITASGTVALATSGVTAGSYGSTTAIPAVTVDTYGRITSITTNNVSTTISLAGTSGTGSVSGGGTLTFAGSNGVTATASGSTITIGTPQNLQTSATPSFSTVTSTVATGTAPFTVTSTTKVSNLNVEQVDGYHAAEANTASNIVVRDSLSNINISGATFAGSTSGTGKIVAPAAAGTGTVITLPAVTSTLATIAGAETLTNKTLTSPTLVTPALGTPSSGNLANCTFPTLNQSTTGSAATLTTGRTIGMTGDVTWTSGSFNGSANVTGTATLANSGVTANSYGSASAIPVVTVNAKGLVTAVSTTTIPKNITVGGRVAAVTIPATTGSITVAGRSGNVTVTLTL